MFNLLKRTFTGKDKTPKTYTIFFLSFIICILLLIVLGSSTQYTPKYPTLELRDGWTISYRSNTISNVSYEEIGNLLPEDLRRGEKVILYHELPDLGELQFPALLMKTRFSSYEVKLGKDKLRAGWQHRVARGQFVGSSQFFVSLPQNYAGKLLKVELTLADTNAFKSGIQIPVLGNQQDLEVTKMNEGLLILSVAAFLCIAGGAFFILTLVFLPNLGDLLAHMASAILCLLLGIWLLCSSYLASFFMGETFVTIMEYTSLYLVLPCCYLMLLGIRKPKNKFIFYTMFSIVCASILICFLLHSVQVVFMNHMLTYFHVLCIICFFLILTSSIADMFHSRGEHASSRAIQVAGLNILAIFMMLAIFFYLIAKKMGLPGANSILNNLMAIGSFLFAFTQILNYLVYVTESVAEKQELTSLNHLAYADGLTGLSNRAYTDKVMEDLDREDEDYCIISMDLNGLKKINDSLGHAAGDRYLTEFAGYLSDVFDGALLCSRIGGDEYMVILKDKTEEEIRSLIARLHEALATANQQDATLHRGVSVSYAFRHECREQDTHSVYMLADQRMYEMKREAHRLGK